MYTYHELVFVVERNLASAGFRVSRDVPLPDSAPADLAASRTKFSWKGLIILSQHFLMRHVPNAGTADFQALFDDGFRYAQKVNRVPLLRGMQFGYLIVPFIAVDAVTPELVEFARNRPRKHWALFEHPVLYDLSTGQVYSYEKTAIWGAAFFSDLRALTRASTAGP